MRGAGHALKKGGTLVYLDVSWQPLGVCLGKDRQITAEEIHTACKSACANEIKVDTQSMKDTRMQNMALLGTTAKHRLVPGVTKENYCNALEYLLIGDMLSENRALFDVYAS